MSHTHWDREWYHSAELFRQRLVALVDELIDDPPASGESFLLDGQAVLLDDYLSVRPERAAELSTLLRDGRIEAGPWYVLADELIPGGEALVRNLLAGRAAVRRLRGEAPPVLYCPDSFGHPAVLPDLARGFGCDLAILWRGHGGARDSRSDMARWRSATGAEVLLYHLPPHGYEFGSELPTDPGSLATRWSRIASVLGPRAVTGTALLLNGADHHARQRGLHDAIAALAVAAAPVRVRHISLRGAAAEVVAAASRIDLPIVEGERRDSYGYTWTLQGTLATRAAQKRRNAIAERTLVRDVEPWLALLAGGSDERARALLRAAWRTLLLAHPHDTLCGTSIDDVATAMDARLASAVEQGEGIRVQALFALLGHDVEQARTSASAWRPAVVLRNPTARPRGGVVELTLSATVADVAVGPGSGARQGSRRRVPPWRVEGMPLQILARRERVALTESPRAYPDADLIVEVRALGWVDRLAGYGVTTRFQRKGDGSLPRNPVRAEGHTLDNGLVRVEVSEGGVVRMIDLATGRVVNDVVTLADVRDVGDLYTPAPREPLPPARLRRVRLVHRGPLRGEIALDFDLITADGRNGGRCHIALQLDANLAALRIAIDGENRGRDHRLRVHIATDLADAVTVADAAFHPVARLPLTVAPEDAQMEQGVSSAPLHRWVARFSADAGATIFSDGLAEYESFDDGSVAVTLLRAVGELSRHDLPERPGHAGWPAPTPDAQSLGPFSARLAIALHEADSPVQRDAIERLADDVLLPIVGETLRSNLADESEGAGLELEGDGLVFSAAAPAQREGWTMLRCVNRRPHRVRGGWRLYRPVNEAVRARLDETPLAPLAVAERSIVFDAEPYEIVTVLLR
ncbi:MAG TPA: glycoside hydrolase family 38 C-terminal domain-containing protein [Gemmatimonadaceae bacterium]|nr:glycoside hydrolase family 38 C-terminal domain-containing protein [Gemmatimonadaceae bacterium]